VKKDKNRSLAKKILENIKNGEEKNLIEIKDTPKWFEDYAKYTYESRNKKR